MDPLHLLESQLRELVGMPASLLISQTMPGRPRQVFVSVVKNGVISTHGVGDSLAGAVDSLTRTLAGREAACAPLPTQDVGSFYEDDTDWDDGGPHPSWEEEYLEEGRREAIEADIYS